MVKTIDGLTEAQFKKFDPRFKRDLLLLDGQNKDISWDDTVRFSVNVTGNQVPVYLRHIVNNVYTGERTYKEVFDMAKDNRYHHFELASRMGI